MKTPALRAGRFLFVAISATAVMKNVGVEAIQVRQAMACVQQVPTEVRQDAAIGVTTSQWVGLRPVDDRLRGAKPGGSWIASSRRSPQ